MAYLPQLRPSQIFALLCVLLAVATVGVTADLQARVLAISLAGIALFATRSLPEATTALCVFLAFLAINAAPTNVIFSGFTVGGFWLLIGGLVIGAAISSSGLDRQIARRIFARTGSSYSRAVCFLSLGGVVLGLFVPSAIPRVIVMMPITMALARTMGFTPMSRGYVGLIMTAALMTLVPTFAFLTANLPTIVEFGAAEVLYDVQVSYSAYLVQNLPISLVRFAVLLAMLLMFGRGISSLNTTEMSDDAPEQLTRAQTRLMWLLAGAIGFWATDVWHGIAPSWVALTAGMILLWPGFGVFTAQAIKSEIDLSAAFFIAAVFCISAVMDSVGIGAGIARAVVPVLALGQHGSLWDMFATTGFSALLSHLTTSPAAPIVLAPLAGHMSDATSWSVTTIAMLQNIGFSTTAIPYQSPPLLICIAMAQIPVGTLTRICLVSSVVITAIGVPATWLWWMWLGLI